MIANNQISSDDRVNEQVVLTRLVKRAIEHYFFQPNDSLDSSSTASESSFLSAVLSRSLSSWYIVPPFASWRINLTGNSTTTSTHIPSQEHPQLSPAAFLMPVLLLPHPPAEYTPPPSHNPLNYDTALGGT